MICPCSFNLVHYAVDRRRRRLANIHYVAWRTFGWSLGPDLANDKLPDPDAATSATTAPPRRGGQRQPDHGLRRALLTSLTAAVGTGHRRRACHRQNPDALGLWGPLPRN